jgi:hypothetical protein
MQKLSIGLDSTLGSYHKLCSIFFGEDSVQARFIAQQIAKSPNGTNEEVVADESQMMYLLFNLNEDTTMSLGELLA